MKRFYNDAQDSEAAKEIFDVFSDYKNRKWNYGFTQMKDGRWRVRNRDGGKTLWSHVVYQNYYLNGAEIPKGYIVHHKDRNNQNDDPDNLEILLQKFHGALHMKINNLFSKRVILIKNNVIMEFDSGLAASRGLKLSRNAVNEAIRRKHKVKGWIAIQHENVLAETLPHL